MKHLYLLTFLFISLTTNSQKTGSWNTSSIFNPNDSKEYLQQIDSAIFTGSDLQIRLWFWSAKGLSRKHIIVKSFLYLVRKNKTWSASYCTFSKDAYALNSTTVMNQRQIQHFNIDSVYKEVINDSLLLIRSDTIGRLLDDRGDYSYLWTGAGPTNYLIEILTPTKIWSLRYPCPKYFYDKYKIAELKNPLKIIATLMSLIGLNPC